MSGKGDFRRPAAVPEETIESNWKRTFGKKDAVSHCLSQKLGYSRCKSGQPCVNPEECPR